MPARAVAIDVAVRDLRRTNVATFEKADAAARGRKAGAVGNAGGVRGTRTAGAASVV